MLLVVLNLIVAVICAGLLLTVSDPAARVGCFLATVLFGFDAGKHLATLFGAA